MNKWGVVAFVVVLVIMVVFYFYTTGTNKQTGIVPFSTTSVQKSTAATSLLTTSTTPPINISNSTPPSLGCLSKSPTMSIYNGNFSTGTFVGWNVSGVGFGSTPINITAANKNGAYYGSPWSNYNGRFFASTYHGGLSLTPGNITSTPFVVTEPYINFRIVSTQDNLLYVEVLLSGGRHYIISYYNTYNGGTAYGGSTFANASVPVLQFLCQNVSIKVFSGVVGTVSTSNRFIAAGGFYLSRVAAQTPGILVNQTIV